MEPTNMMIRTPRGAFKIHTIFSSEEEAREHGWGAWFWHGDFIILGKENRVGAVVKRNTNP